MMFSEPYQGLRADPGSHPGVEPASAAARRSRAELHHLDRAHGRLERGQSFHLALRRHLRAVRPAAWRRQFGGHAHAAVHS